MKVFAVLMATFANSVLVKLLKEDGNLITVYESRDTEGARRFAENYILKNGEVFEWCEVPQLDQEYIRATHEYENNWYTEFLGDCRTRGKNE